MFLQEGQTDTEREGESAETDLYRDNPATPYYSRGKVNISEKDMYEAITGSRCPTCTKRPLNVHENACFLIDTNSLRSRSDYLYDDNGSYRNHGTRGFLFDIDSHEQKMGKVRKSEAYKIDSRKYNILWCTYWVHTNYPDFKRKTYEVETQNGFCGNVFVRYSFDDEEHPLSPAKHKSTKKRFYPTSTSTKASIKKEILSQTGPVDIYDGVFEASGGISNAEAISDLPRNARQVKNARAKARSSLSNKQEFGTFMMEAKNNDFIHNFEAVSQAGPRAVLASNFQLEDIENMCCNPQKFSIFSMDTTFNIGRLYFTSTVYQHLKLVHRETGEHPHLPGPALMHTGQDASQFQYFGHSLKELHQEIDGILAIGCDRDRAMINGAKRVFEIARFVFCTKHVKDDISRKLQQLKLRDEECTRCLDDIFGNRKKGVEGLIDSESPADFDTKLHHVSGKWNEEFGRYFGSNIATDMKEGMIKCVRKTYGVGNKWFYNNASEGLHSKFKQKIKQRKTNAATSGQPNKCSWTETAGIYQDMCSRVRRDVQRALIDQGPYKLHPEFEHLGVDIEKWRNMTPSEQKEKMAALDSQWEPSIEYIDDACQPNNNMATDNDNLDDQRRPPLYPFMGDLPSNMPPSLTDSSWRNANKILEQNGVIAAPGPSNSQHLKKLVISLTCPDKYHLVKFSNSGSTCDCEGFARNKLCAHVLAVAKTEDCLDTLVASWAPTIDDAVVLPSGVSKKPTEKVPRYRKKRQPSAEEEETSERTKTVKKKRGNQFPDDENAHVTFLQTVNATVCYKCKKRWRPTGGSPPPLQPHDIVLGRKEKRIYHKRGAPTQVFVTATKENVYYCAKKSCINIHPDNIVCSADVQSELKPEHRAWLRQQFGLNIPG